MPTSDKLTEAYEAWRRAHDAHVEMMREVTHGARLDVQAMTQQVGEIDGLHATWMEMVIVRDDKAP